MLSQFSSSLSYQVMQSNKTLLESIQISMNSFFRVNAPHTDAPSHVSTTSTANMEQGSDDCSEAKKPHFSTAKQKTTAPPPHLLGTKRKYTWLKEKALVAATESAAKDVERYAMDMLFNSMTLVIHVKLTRYVGFISVHSSQELRDWEDPSKASTVHFCWTHSTPSLACGYSSSGGECEVC